VRRVPYVNLIAQHEPIKTELIAAISRVLDHSNFILGEEVEEFESAFAELSDCRYAVGLNSGTDALILALRALDIGPGDEVITAPNSFIASASAIKMCGATPVLADVRDDMNLDPDCVEAAITARTKAMIVIHLTGRPADMAALADIARRHGLRVIEDAAQSVSAALFGRRVGSFGDIGCFSLHPLKTLNACGDGGVATTQDEVLYKRLKVLRNIGLQSRDDAIEWSGNSRLDALQAAILKVKLRYLPNWTEARRANAAYYQQALHDVVQVPVDPPDMYAVYHTFVIQGDRRDELKAALLSAGVETAIHYPIPIHLMSVGRSLGYDRGSFPVAERQAERILSLPVYPELSEPDRAYVADRLRHFYIQP
jgi:dTDP-4-amino-4,6-dideoxygalactose transaminase